MLTFWRPWQWLFQCAFFVWFLIENYVEVFYMIYEQDTPSFQCRLSINQFTLMWGRWPKACLHWFLCFGSYTMTPLKWGHVTAFWEHNLVIHTDMSSANRVRWTLGFLGDHLCNIVEGGGQDRTLWYPCSYFQGCGHFALYQNSLNFLSRMS